jgi:hypothetical protein
VNVPCSTLPRSALPAQSLPEKRCRQIKHGLRTKKAPADAGALLLLIVG